jgi:hypothetical protein
MSSLVHDDAILSAKEADLLAMVPVLLAVRVRPRASGEPELEHGMKGGPNALPAKTPPAAAAAAPAARVSPAAATPAIPPAGKLPALLVAEQSAQDQTEHTSKCGLGSGRFIIPHGIFGLGALHGLCLLSH